MQICQQSSYLDGKVKSIYLLSKIRKLLSHQFVSHASLKHHLIGLLLHIHFGTILRLDFKAVPLLSLIRAQNIAYMHRKPALQTVGEGCERLGH